MRPPPPALTDTSSTGPARGGLPVAEPAPVFQRLVSAGAPAGRRPCSRCRPPLFFPPLPDFDDGSAFGS